MYTNKLPWTIKFDTKPETLIFRTFYIMTLITSNYYHILRRVVKSPVNSDLIVHFWRLYPRYT